MTTVTPLTFLGNEVRIIVDGEPLFVLNDLCDVLGIVNPRNVAARLDDDTKGARSVDTPGGPQQMTVVTEAGMYDVILRSDSPNAKPLRRWLTTDVLPAIRRTGTYTVPAAGKGGKAVTIGQPMRGLPDRGNPGRYQPAKHWLAVAAACRQHPGLWHPVAIEGFTYATYRSSVGLIRHGQLAAFRSGAWDAALRDGALYVRCLPDADELLRSAQAPAIETGASS